MTSLYLVDDKNSIKSCVIWASTGLLLLNCFLRDCMMTSVLQLWQKLMQIYMMFSIWKYRSKVKIFHCKRLSLNSPPHHMFSKLGYWCLRTLFLFIFCNYSISTRKQQDACLRLSVQSHITWSTTYPTYYTSPGRFKLSQLCCIENIDVKIGKLYCMMTGTGLTLPALTLTK